jgi:hypothetical protein
MSKTHPQLKVCIICGAFFHENYAKEHYDIHVKSQSIKNPQERPKTAQESPKKGSGA